jgi:pre-mRNA-splicing factor 18
VQRELRLLGLPITYFGETSIGQRLQRLQNAQTHQSIIQLQEREADEFRLKQGFGIRNTFLEKDDMKDVMQLSATAEFQDESNKTDHNHERKSKNNQHKDSKVVESGNTNTNNNSGSHNHDRIDTTTEVEDDGDKHKRIYKHFKGLLKQWENDLNQRSDEVKRSLAGRNETKKVKQCKDYIRPLFQLCKRRQLDENMVEKLYAMVLFCEQGEFVRAHDAYMDIAIGRAAWPIGVTMVGIHARTGRAKIESSNVAHVMNSELQRKYLTSVKRLLTYEQNLRTDVDPSKKVR